MTSKALNNRKKKEEREQGKATRRNKQKQIIDAEGDDKKCPVFSVQYLGKTPAGGEYGREYIKEPVETLLRLKDRRPKQQDSALHISEKGFHFLDKNGPFGKEKHVLIPIHHICYGVVDEHHPHVFAIITRTDSSSENSLFDCHAFWCGHKKTAQEVTYWLLRTFLQVFNDLQKKRKDRQDRKLRKQKEATLGVPISPSPPTSPDGLNLAMYSVIFEGPSSKGHGAAVRLTRNSRPQTIGSANPTAHRIPPDASYFNGGSGGTINSGMQYQSQPLSTTQPRPSGKRGRAPAPPPPVTIMPPTAADGASDDSLDMLDPFAPHDPRPITIVPGRSKSLNSRGPYGSVNGQPAPDYPQPRLPSAMGPTNTHLLSPPHSRPRYEKRPGSRTSSGISPSQGSGSSVGSMTRDSNKEGDFIFIDMLQEAFSDIGDSASRAAPGKWYGRGRRPSGASSGSGNKFPLEKLTSEDIERRIRQWLIEGEEPNNNISGDGYSESQYSSHQGPVFHYGSSRASSSGAASTKSGSSTHVSGTYGGAEDNHYF